MKDVNNVRLSGTVFWSKLDEKQSYSILRMGLKLESGATIFCSVNNPKIKTYELIKPGNKILIVNGWFDLWAERNENQIKTYSSGAQFFAKDSRLPNINEFTIVGTVIRYSEEFATIEIVGDRNPKTNEWSKRTAIVKIGDTYKDIESKRIIIQGRVASEEIDGKSKLVIEADYNKISLI